MSTIKVANISHPSATSPAIKLAADGTAGIAALNVNTESGTTYTFTADDAGKLVAASNASAKTFTIPPQSSVAWAAGTVLNVVNYGAGALTVNGGSGVTVTNTATTLAQFQSAAAIRTAENAWTLVPFAGGVGNADFSNTATGTYTSGSDSFKYVTFTGSGTLTVTKEGFADVLVVGGGGGGGVETDGSRTSAGGGGGGAVIYSASIFVPAGTTSVTVGAGGSAGSEGGFSSILGIIAIGGARGTGGFNGRSNGANGGGASPWGSNSVSLVGGFSGASGTGSGPDGRTGSGGGGGAGGAGQNGGYDTSLGLGGVGVANSITGSSVTRAAGGAGGITGLRTPVAGDANTGNGGGGSSLFPGSNQPGGSGVVIVRVKV